MTGMPIMERSHRRIRSESSTQDVSERPPHNCESRSENNFRHRHGHLERTMTKQDRVAELCLSASGRLELLRSKNLERCYAPPSGQKVVANPQHLLSGLLVKASRQKNAIGRGQSEAAESELLHLIAQAAQLCKSDSISRASTIIITCPASDCVSTIEAGGRDSHRGDASSCCFRLLYELSRAYFNRFTATSWNSFVIEVVNGPVSAPGGITLGYATVSVSGENAGGGRMKISLTDQPDGGSAVIGRDGRQACVDVDLKMAVSPDSNRFTSFWEVNVTSLSNLDCPPPSPSTVTCFGCFGPSSSTLTSTLDMHVKVSGHDMGGRASFARSSLIQAKSGSAAVPEPGVFHFPVCNSNVPPEVYLRSNEGSKPLSQLAWNASSFPPEHAGAADAEAAFQHFISRCKLQGHQGIPAQPPVPPSVPQTPRGATGYDEQHTPRGTAMAYSIHTPRDGQRPVAIAASLVSLSAQNTPRQVVVDSPRRVELARALPVLTGYEQQHSPRAIPVQLSPSVIRSTSGQAVLFPFSSGAQQLSPRQVNMRVSHAASDFRASSPHFSTSSYQSMRNQTATCRSNNDVNINGQQTVHVSSGPYIPLQHSPRGAPPATAQVPAHLAFPASIQYSPRRMAGASPSNLNQAMGAVYPSSGSNKRAIGGGSQPPSVGGYRVISRPLGGGGSMGGNSSGGGGGGGRRMEIAMGDVQEYKDYQQVYLGGGGGGSAGVQPHHYPGGGGSVANDDDDDDCGGEFGGYSSGYYSQQQQGQDIIKKIEEMSRLVDVGDGQQAHVQTQDGDWNPPSGFNYDAQNRNAVPMSHLIL